MVEQLGKARLKRPESMHVIIVPWLMTGRWRRHLGRGTDGYFKVKDCDGIWSLLAQFEPILIYVCLPYKSHDPRLDERWELLNEIQGALQERDLSTISARERGGILHKLLESARKLCPLPRGLVSPMLQSHRTHGVSSHPSV
jgi:hypothetical protein